MIKLILESFRLKLGFSQELNDRFWKLNVQQEKQSFKTFLYQTKQTKIWKSKSYSNLIQAKMDYGLVVLKNSGLEEIKIWDYFHLNFIQDGWVNHLLI